MAWLLLGLALAAAGLEFEVSTHGEIQASDDGHSRKHMRSAAPSLKKHRSSTNGSAEQDPETALRPEVYTAITSKVVVYGGVSGGKKYLVSNSDGDSLYLSELEDEAGRSEFILTLGTTGAIPPEGNGGQWHYIQVYGGVDGNRRYLSADSDGTSCSLSDLHVPESGRQRWIVTPADGGAWYHIQVGGGVSADRTFLSTNQDGTKIGLSSSDDGSGRQRWKLLATPATATARPVPSAVSAPTRMGTEVTSAGSSQGGTDLAKPDVTDNLRNQVEENLKLPFGGQASSKDANLPAAQPTCSPGAGNSWEYVQLVVDTATSSDCILGDITDDGSLARGLCSTGRWAWGVEGQEDGSVRLYNIGNQTLSTNGTSLGFDGEFDRWFIIRTAADTYKIMSGDHMHNYLGHRAIGKFGISSVGVQFAIYEPSANGVASTMAATLPVTACTGSSIS